MEKDKNSEKQETHAFTRREALKLSGLALGGLAIGGSVLGLAAGKALANEECACPEAAACSWGDTVQSQQYSYFDELEPFYPVDPANKETTIAPLDKNQMRITFMGSSIPPNMRRVQQMMSIFVEVGWDDNKQMPLDQFVFDCGSGVCNNYGAMNVGFGRMDKIFLTHLHGDHMSDLTHIYCFGPSADRKTPLYVWGHGNSGVKRPGGGRYDDGVKTFCKHLRKACRWHTESFSFQTTSYPGYPTPSEVQKNWGLPHKPKPVADDRYDDGYAMIPIELDWTKYGKVPGDNIAYNNTKTGVKITHFPVIHARKGSVGYKLEWTSPNKTILSMIFTGDTKPEYHSIGQAANGGKGVDVFIHEMGVAAEVWAFKNIGLSEPPPPGTPGWEETVNQMKMVQNSSHSPQGAFGYLLSQINPRPRLTVATHFPVDNETVACAMKSVQEHCDAYQGNGPLPEGAARITWSFDRMVITVSKDQILEQKGEVSDFSNPAKTNLPEGDPNPPIYHNPDGTGDPYAQIDRSTEIPACNRVTNACNYRDDGY
jgi:ribonuclease Z